MVSSVAIGEYGEKIGEEVRGKSRLYDASRDKCGRDIGEKVANLREDDKTLYEDIDKNILIAERNDGNDGKEAPADLLCISCILVSEGRNLGWKIKARAASHKPQ
jgi:hypothetical protein